MNDLNKINVTDLNEYDVQRILRENIIVLENRNAMITNNLSGDSDIPPDMIMEFAEELSDNAAETLYILSIADNTLDIQTYVESSPLFREGGAGK